MRIRSKSRSADFGTLKRPASGGKVGLETLRWYGPYLAILIDWEIERGSSKENKINKDQQTRLSTELFRQYLKSGRTGIGVPSLPERLVT